MTTVSLAEANVLITGGSDGIGLALARRFLDAGSKVLVTGRNQDRLRLAQNKHAQLRVRVNDVSSPADRVALAEYVRDQMPGLNILINNAGFSAGCRLLPRLSNGAHAR